MTSTTQIQLLAAAPALAGRATGAFIDGRMVATASDLRLDVYDPATEEVIARLGEAGESEVDAAVRSAHTAFEDGRWSRLRPADRERILLKFADLVEAHGEELAQIESWNQGKSINIARAIDVGATVEYMRYVAGLATKITGHTLDVSIPVPPGARFNAYTRREPLGVVAGVAPWNFPLMIGVWKVMPSLAAGCTVVLKPSEITPLTSFRLAELALDAGVPPGVFNVVNGRGQTTGKALTTHPLVAKVSFTGSTPVGKDIARACIDNMTRVALELGGKNPAIVLGDANLEKVVPGLLAGSLLNSGQVCAAASRIYVERNLYGPLVDALSGAMTGMSMGPGLDPAAEVNPLVSAIQRDRVRGHIATAREHGADIVSGAKTPDRGYFVAPTLVVGAKADHPIQKAEVFGPVVSITAVDSAEEAIALSNDSRYGLASSLWTENLSRAMDAIPQIRAGTVWVNSHIPLDPNMPFGGVKESGMGRDFGPQALDAFTETKSVCIAY
ncbi:aldehyde dehydrogenase family protein [Phenylobacterium sp.]|uniref:aldehyde dehydrogenase family protein n=1 Tax=Phenylobacterium sp. TaxID=1871053 RepID=UPI0035AF7B4B